MQVWTILLLLSIMCMSCAGTRQESESKYSDKSYSEMDAEYYGPDGEGNCFYHNSCGGQARKVSAPIPPGRVYLPVPKNTPPVPMVPLYPKTYRYSGVGPDGFTWGRITVDQNGHYNGWNNQDGFTYGNVQVQ